MVGNLPPPPRVAAWPDSNASERSKAVRDFFMEVTPGEAWARPRKTAHRGSVRTVGEYVGCFFVHLPGSAAVPEAQLVIAPSLAAHRCNGDHP